MVDLSFAVEVFQYQTVPFEHNQEFSPWQSQSQSLIDAHHHHQDLQQASKAHDACAPLNRLPFPDPTRDSSHEPLSHPKCFTKLTREDET